MKFIEHETPNSGEKVAIKVLPEEFARDQERLSRFEREARLLAQVNHANIAALYGLEEHDGQKFIVMELVEGETLAERIAKGPILLDEAIPLFIQIAEGLEAAHEKGIIHRDLKPANIKIGLDGKPNILDFGLAKAFVGEDGTVTDSSQSPTLTKGSALGVIMGTPSYMSPEQARGKIVDKRADIWAFGCVFFEALTGQSAFVGETVSHTLVNILEHEPDWESLSRKAPPSVPSVIDVIRRCLRKAPEKRLRDIGEARIRLGEVSDPSASALTASLGRPRQLARLLPWGVAAAALGMALVANFGRDRPPPLSPMRLHLNVRNPISTFDFLRLIALSPDGRRLVYGSGGKFFLRNFHEDEETAVPGIEGAYTPFFSPDGESLGFGMAGASLVTLSLTGGLPLAVTAVNDSMGASWGDDGDIYYSEANTAMSRVPAGGGTSEVVTSLGPGENAIHGPHVLPGAQAVVFTVYMGGGAGNSKVVVQKLGGERRVEIPKASSGRYAASGHLVYAQADALLAVPFDLARLELMGEPVTVLEGVRVDPSFGGAQFALSVTGTLAYLPAVDASLRLVWVSRNGEMTAVTDRRQLYRTPRLSPNGRQLAVTVQGADGSQIWVMDLERGNLSRATVEGNNAFQAWSPDGERLLFASDRAGASDLYIKSADGGGEASRVTEGEYDRFPTDWVGDTIVLVALNHRPARMSSSSRSTRRTPSGQSPTDLSVKAQPTSHRTDGRSPIGLTKRADRRSTCRASSGSLTRRSIKSL